ncbi:MAG: biopolymer transporter ExbD [Planctomycetes bacterium]|nr:biopolymer transporter ExbD [Planctomycetota bacterium]
MKNLQPRATEHVNPNLIPMIDIMFLLLLFFMLGADMGQRELESVNLPKAEEAKVDPALEKDHRLTINAHHNPKYTGCAYSAPAGCHDESHWTLTFRGEDCTEGKKLSNALARTTDPGGLPLNERKVMIRADGGAPFALAQRAMGACAENGIYKVEVGAAKRPVR